MGDVVGQEHVAQSLRNAILSGRVAHAYLFTGARGVGKTSSARILAKALNCPNSVNAEPCHTCEICQGIATGSDVDVLEIDGASNRGIDDIRQLRANVNVRSMRSKYKVYIIDEVHMLTKEAFNALLKTLEEPPPNVKFIFCTTEPNKVPDTILSRCQRFDFGTIATSNIKLRLQQISEAEGRVVSSDAMELIARRAAGSMRDSQSLFDQLLAFGGAQIETADVHRLLGTAPDERLIELVAALIEQQPGLALDLFHTALGDGVQLAELTDQLLGYMRDLLIAAAGAKNVPFQSLADENFSRLQAQAQQWGLKRILAAMQILADTKGKMRGTTYGRSLAEMALVRLANLQDLGLLEQAIGYLKSGATVSASPGGSSSISPAPRPAIPERRSPAANPSNPPVAEKKNEPAAPVAVATPAAIPVSPPPAAPRATPEPAAAAAPQFELKSGQEKEFWTTVCSQLTGLLKPAAMRGIPKSGLTAISGPIPLVITFPPQYDTTYLSRNLAEVEKVALKVAGRPVRLQIQTQAAEVAATDTSMPAESVPVPKTAVVKVSAGPRGEGITDRFVLKVAEIFNGQVGDGTVIN